MKNPWSYLAKHDEMLVEGYEGVCANKRQVSFRSASTGVETKPAVDQLVIWIHRLVLAFGLKLWIVFLFFWTKCSYSI